MITLADLFLAIVLNQSEQLTPIINKHGVKIRVNTVANTFSWFTNNADPIVRLGETADQWNIGTGSFGYGTMTPDASAVIDLTSTTKGFLPPRMTTVEMNAIGTPATGLMVYDTTTNQWMGYNGTSWTIIG